MFISAGMFALLLPARAYAYDGARLNVSNDEVNSMARVVMAEAGIESFECKQAVAETIVNRTLSEDPAFPDTVTEVLYQENAYATEYTGEVTDDCYQAVYDALDRKIFEPEIKYFRLGHYHSFGIDCFQIDHTFFSM